jgi:hypothetical protein
MACRRGSIAEVGLVVLALLGLLGGPCAMALGMVAGVEPAVHQSAGAHDQCPNAGSTRQMTEDSCCCLARIAGAVGEPVAKPMPVFIAAPVSIPAIEMPDVATQAVGAPLRACLHQTSPPVYLVTRRLRL